MTVLASFVADIFQSPLMHNPVFVLFSVIAIGLLVGRITIYGVSLGSAAVMFVALVYGHYGITLSPSITTVGLVLFVYCVGIGAGSRFFSMLRQSGVQLAIISCIVIFVGGASTALAATFFDISPSVATGIFAGALTSTPGLAAAQEHFTNASDQGLVSAGYAIAYPFGVIGTVLFVQLWPRLRKKDLQLIGEEIDSNQSDEHKVTSLLVKVTNPKFVGRKIGELKILDHLHCRVTRVMENGVLMPRKHGAKFALDQLLWVVGRENDIAAMLDVIGERAEAPVIINADVERRTLIVTNRLFANKTLSELRLLRDHGVTVSRIKRYEYEIIPNDSTQLHIGDQLVTIGNKESIAKFAKTIGHKASSIDATDLLSLSLGIAIGVFVGTLSFGGFKLGMAGGPLLVALLLGHFGRVGVIAGYVPRPTRLLLRELGLCLFLAGAGIKGGASFVATLQDQGMGIFIVGILATLLPIITGYAIAVLAFRFNILTALGGVCGAMTSTPGLGAISSKTESQAPILSYASAYPAALLLMVVGVNILLAIMTALA